MTTSIEDARRMWRFAAVTQLVAVGNAVLLAIYLAEGMLMFAAIELLIIILISYYAISLAWKSGAKWPSGEKQP